MRIGCLLLAVCMHEYNVYLHLCTAQCCCCHLYHRLLAHWRKHIAFLYVPIWLLCRMYCEYQAHVGRMSRTGGRGIYRRLQNETKMKWRRKKISIKMNAAVAFASTDRYHGPVGFPRPLSFSLFISFSIQYRCDISCLHCATGNLAIKSVAKAKQYYYSIQLRGERAHRLQWTTSLIYLY